MKLVIWSDLLNLKSSNINKATRYKARHSKGLGRQGQSLWLQDQGPDQGLVLQDQSLTSRAAAVIFKLTRLPQLEVAT